MRKEFYPGNVVSWRGELWVVQEDKETCVILIPFNSSNCTAYPSNDWPSKKEGRAAIKFVSETIYGWLVKGMKKSFGIKGALSANGWTPH